MSRRGLGRRAFDAGSVGFAAKTARLWRKKLRRERARVMFR
jgi:hypothetical protein